MSHAKGQQPEEAVPSFSSDALAAIEGKRETLERVSKTDYPVAEHAEALLELIESDD